MVRLDGKLVSVVRRERLKKKIDQFLSRTGKKPGLAVVLVGDDPASQVYVNAKVKACHEVGIQSFEHRLPQGTHETQIKKLMDELNADDQVHGILVQLPLPQYLSDSKVLDWLQVDKDVDGLKPESMGYLWTGHPIVVPCTPAGVMAILEHYQIDVAGMQVVVVGRSNIVGKPMAHLLIAANATVTLCHSKTKNIYEWTREADLVVVAVGKSQFLGREDFKKQSVVIDVGIHRALLADGSTKLCGDVRFSELEGWVQAATPVPGGVGPMTITMLLENTVCLAERKYS